jgi:hypothetical protein
MGVQDFMHVHAILGSFYCERTPPLRMINTFISSAKKKLQASYDMEDFGQLPKYVMGDGGHYGVYYDYKHALQM